MSKPRLALGQRQRGYLAGDPRICLHRQLMSVSDQLLLLHSWLSDAAKWYDSEIGEFIKAFQNQCGTLSLASLHLLEMVTHALTSGQLDTTPTSMSKHRSALIAHALSSLAPQPARSSTSTSPRSAKPARTGKKSKARSRSGSRKQLTVRYKEAGQKDFRDVPISQLGHLRRKPHQAWLPPRKAPRPPGSRHKSSRTAG